MPRQCGVSYFPEASNACFCKQREIRNHWSEATRGIFWFNGSPFRESQRQSLSPQIKKCPLYLSGASFFQDKSKSK